MTEYAKEAGHWYDKDGNPCYTLIGKNGKERNTTLADARKLRLLPSVTTIIRCAAAPGLERWKQQQVLHAALTLPLIPGESEDAYLDRIMKDSQEQGKKAAERGTAIHGALERRDDTGPYAEHVKAAYGAIEREFGVLKWQAENSFAHEWGFGGKVDLHSADAQGWVLDFKTTDKDIETVKTWDEHHLQLAAYRRGLDLRSARCAIVYVSVDGKAKVIELTQDELQRGWLMFHSLLNYWYYKSGLMR